MLGCPKLTPLQSRFAASVAALALVALIYWSFSNPTFAYAAELAVDGAGVSRNGEDHNWHRIVEERLVQDGVELETRAPAVVMTIGGNNFGNVDNINAGQTTVWSYSKQLLLANHTATGPGLPADAQPLAKGSKRREELRKREDGQLLERQSSGPRTIYVSINTCIQPGWNGTETQSTAPPQLVLYVSTDASNTNPGPNATASSQVRVPLVGGFANATVQASETWYMSVHAPALPNGFSGVWNYELAVSIDDYFHQAHPEDPNLFLIDADTSSALLVTGNLTQTGPNSESYKAWLDLTAPFIVFASNVNNTRTMGVENSFCGLHAVSQFIADQSDPNGESNPVHMDMITRGLGDKPKEQFYITQLNKTSSYQATLALLGNSTAAGNGVVGGGGAVWSPVPFSTKSDGNCALLFNLTFCSDVAYAVPSTPSFRANLTNFHYFYDNYTLYYYQQFNYSLQQIPCHTTAAAQYSLAVNCDDCATAYKEWLCAVSIPRCADFSRPASDVWLQPRNMAQQFYNNASFLGADILGANFIPMYNAPTLEGTPAFSQTYNTSLATNSSRNVQIDQVIQPGPYKEVLPCDDLCYNLARSCPAALGFTCPFAGRGLEMGYGRRNPTGNGTITCSYPGAYVSFSAAGHAYGGLSWGLFLFSLVGMLIMSAV